MVTVTHFAYSTHGQPNNNHPSASNFATWGDEKKSCASNVTMAPQGSSTSVYAHIEIPMPKIGKKTPKKAYKDAKPWTWTGLELKFNIPHCAYINKIRFEVPIKITGSSKIPSPRARFNFYNGTKTVKDNFKDDKGWKGGYFYQPSNHKNLSNKWTTHVYEMSGTEFRKRGYPVSECNEPRFGIDLNWKDPTTMKNSIVSVYVKYLKCTIEYEMPNESVTFERVTTGNDPQFVDCGKWYPVQMTYQNKSNAGCCEGVSKDLKITIPPNAQIMQYDPPFNPQTKTWTVQCKPNDKETITIWLKDYSIGLGRISVQDVVKGTTWDYWVYSAPQEIDVGEVTGYVGKMQKDVRSCVTFESIINASDGVGDYYVSLVNDREISPNKPPLPLPQDTEWVLDEEKSSDGVTLASVDSTDLNNVHLRFNVPRNEPVNVVFSGCFLPQFTGMAFASCEIDFTGCDVDYNVLDPPIYIVRNTPKLDESDWTVEEITLHPSIIDFKTHRVASSTEIGAYVIDCGIADLDGAMIEDECTISANVWEKLDYIGCVPLHYHHYDPDSTYSNKGISESYKNKTYKGKEGVIDENISLKFKAKAKEVPVLQGLVKLDKPTPINANWRCFEGDPLNHRGWVVFSQIKCTRTNPLWYDCEAEVDYLTHDINTKFQIFKELQVNTQQMPEIMAEKFSLGENLSTGLDIFNVDTDGGFVYDEDSDSSVRNLFSLDEGQHLDISTRNILSNKSRIRFDWYSTKIEEIRENTIQRIFRLKDADGNPVFEYEYTNFSFYEDYITCDIIVRVMNAGKSWVTQYYNDVDLRTELEVDPVADTGDDEEIDVEIITVDDATDVDDDDSEEPDYTDVAYEEEYIAPSFDTNEYDVTMLYGSSIEFELNANELSVYESGYNGREVTIKNIQLLNSNGYTFETIWTNNNVDGTTEDVLSYIDISLEETLIDTVYANYYNNLVVSPFPIPYKTVVFTRESEEGTIYYLTGEEPFKYRIEPYYQYHCGCDMVTREGVSIFDLNNSYTYFYIENGLVRLGFNKFNGRLYLAKWDIVSKEWVTTHYFHMSNDIKFSLESYSDDKIVIKAGTDTFFTIWRGHPYIGIKNPHDSIFFDDNFNYCLSDKINGQNLDYPTIFSFLNTNNLLPACIGGTKLDYDCMFLDDDVIVEGIPHTLTIVEPLSNPVARVDTTFDVTLNPSTTDGSVHYLINGIDKATVEYPFDLTYQFDEAGDYTIQAVYVGDDDDMVAISEKIAIKVDNPPLDPNGQTANDPDNDIAGQYHLKIISAPSKFTYNDGKQVVLQLTKGSTPLNHKPVEIQKVTGATVTEYTDIYGKIYLKNRSVEVGNYQWGGRFYDVLDDDHNGVLVCKALRYIKVVKAKPKFTYNATDGKLNKGKYLHITLNGAVSPLKNQKVTYKINDGTKKTKTTNDKGKIYIPFNTKNTYKIQVMYAGNKNYEAISKKFTIKVV